VNGDGTPDYTSAVFLTDALSFSQSMLDGSGVAQFLHDLLDPTGPLPPTPPASAPAKPRGNLTAEHTPTADAVAARAAIQTQLDTAIVAGTDPDRAALRQSLADWFNRTDGPNGCVLSRLDDGQANDPQLLDGIH